MVVPEWIKILIIDIDRQGDLVDRIRHKGLVYYCMLQMLRALFLVIYSFVMPEFQIVFIGALIPAILVNSLTIFFARINYKKAAKIYIIFSLIAQSGFLFSLKMTEAIGSVMLINFFSLAILALVAVNGIWAARIIVIGLTTLAVDYLIYLFGDFGLTITGYGNGFHGAVMNGFNITCVFAYFVFFVNFFIDYYKLYKHELSLTVYLSSQLALNHRSLMEKKVELEEHVKALEMASSRFKKYSFMNTNTMRRPLEQIKQLVELYEIRDRKENLNEQILEATVELDKVVREMNLLLESVPKAKAPIS